MSKQLLLFFLLATLGSCAKKTELVIGNIVGGTTSKLTSANYSLMVSDRRYVAKMLKNNFGTSPAVTDAIAAQVEANSAFGGSCDIYEEADHPRFNERNINGYLLWFSCTGAAVKLTNNPSMNTVRIASTIKVCEAILETPEALTHALGLVGGTTAVRPTREQLASIYKLFYLYKKPSPEVITAMKALVDSTEVTTEESWKLGFLSVCMAPDWQVY